MHYKCTNTLTYASSVHIIHKVDIFNAYGTPSEDFTFPEPNAFVGSRVISYSKLIVADTQYNLKDKLSLSFNLDSNNKVIIMSYSKMRYN